MANLQQVIQQLMQQGNTYGQSQQPKQKEGASDWERQLALMSLNNQTNPQALALGALLSRLAGQWREDYDRRDRINRGLVGATPDERAQMLQTLQQADPKQYERSLKALAKRGIDTGNVIPQADIGVDFNSLPETDAPFSDIQNNPLQNNQSVAANAEDELRRILGRRLANS